MSAARSRIAQAKAQGGASLVHFDGVVFTALKETEQVLSAYGAAIDRRDRLLQARDKADRAFQQAERER